jgi:hypothetical protein
MRAADAARRVFAERATHTFPPEFVMRTSSAVERRFLEIVYMLERAARAGER